jgi:hypothetical protein
LSQICRELVQNKLPAGKRISVQPSLRLVSVSIGDNEKCLCRCWLDSVTGRGQWADSLAAAVHFGDHSSSLNQLSPTFYSWTSEQISDKPTKQKFDKPSRQQQYCTCSCWSGEQGLYLTRSRSVNLPKTGSLLPCRTDTALEHLDAGLTHPGRLSR